MGKASSAKKVARAARSSRGRGARQQRNWLFPGSVALIVVLGVLLVAFARNQDAADADIEPLLGDHWHAAYGINICGDWQEPLTDGPQDPFGIHTHDDGIIHIHPFSSGAAGTKAQISKFFDQVGLEVSDDRLAFPGSGDEYKAGEDTCGDADAVVRLLRWESPEDETPEEITEGIVDARFLADREIFALVFGEPDAEVPQPLSVPNLDQLTDVAPTDPFAADPTTPSSVPAEGEEGEEGGTTSSSVAEGETEGDTSSTTATTAPAGDTDESTTSSSAP
jgi:hypothetical protein